MGKSILSNFVLKIQIPYCLLTIFAVITLYPQAVLATNWVELVVHENGERVSVETDTIRRQGNFVWFWVRSTYTKSERQWYDRTLIFFSPQIAAPKNIAYARS